MKRIFLMVGILSLSTLSYAQVPQQMQTPSQQNSFQNSQPRNSLNTRDTVGGRTLINDRRNPSDRGITTPNAVTTPALPGNRPPGMPNNTGSAPVIGNPPNRIGSPRR